MYHFLDIIFRTLNFLMFGCFHLWPLYYFHNFTTENIRGFFFLLVCIFAIINIIPLHFSASNVWRNFYQKLEKFCIVLHSFSLCFVSCSFMYFASQYFFVWFLELIFILFIVLIFKIFINLTCIIWMFINFFNSYFNLFWDISFLGFLIGPLAVAGRVL